MMLAIYIVLAWSLVGCVVALLMGRAIAICTGEHQDEMAMAGATMAQAETDRKPLRAVKAA